MIGKYAIMAIGLVMLTYAPADSMELVNKREQHDQRYTLKKRKKAGGTYNKRKKVFKRAKTCFELVGIKYCKD